MFNLESPYYVAAKYAFAIVGGGTLAYTAVRLGYKALRLATKSALRSDGGEQPAVEVQPTDTLPEA